MKQFISLLFAGILIVSCNNDTPKDYVTLTGTITNKNSDELVVRNSDNDIIKNIPVNEDGVFKDTLHLSKGKYAMSDGNEYVMLFLRPGDEINMTLDANEFDESLSFSGKGSDESNYMVNKLLMQEKVFNNINDLYDQPKEAFIVDLDSIKLKFKSFLQEQKNLDADFIQSDIEDTESLFGYLNKRYDEIAKINELIGKASPVFTDYENHDGTRTSLSDLKGKYVYVDVWATWCKPCLAEIPALKELEKEMGEDIHFLSISIDKKDNYETWKQMVIDKELKGVQLYADNNWESQFVQDYGINGIPRFIIIDPQGNVVKPDAPRPSNPKTKELLLDLLR